MNRNRKKKLATLIKVLFAHIFIIFLLDLNISSIISNKPKNINQINNAQLTDAEEKYILTIKSKIESNWLIPHDTKYDKICTVIVNQIPSGKVTDVKVHGCKADILYIDSLINAVWRSSPLPVAPDIEVFQENIVLQFVGPQ